MHGTRIDPLLEAAPFGHSLLLYIIDASAFLRAEPASKTLNPDLLAKAEISISKSDYFRVAEQMKRAEVPPEVIEKMDAIRDVVLPPMRLRPADGWKNDSAKGLAWLKEKR